MHGLQCRLVNHHKHVWPHTTIQSASSLLHCLSVAFQHRVYCINGLGTGSLLAYEIMCYLHFVYQYLLISHCDVHGI